MNKENPFTITFGKQPEKQVSRYEDTDRILRGSRCESDFSDRRSARKRKDGSDDYRGEDFGKR